VSRGGEDSEYVVLIGLGIAALSALATDIGFLMRQRGATAAPDVNIRKPGATVKGLFSQKWWTIGFGVAFVAWSLHVMALKLAPLSLAQAVLASGFVMLAILAERWFGFKVGKREWAGILLTTAGLVLLGVTASEAKTHGAQASYPVVVAILFEAGLILAGAIALTAHRTGRGRGQAGPLLGAGAGLLFTVSHVGIKAMTGQVSFSHPATLLTPWVALIVAAFVAAFFASARSLQVGEAVPVIAITSAVSNVTAILAGVVVFNDPLGSTPLVVCVRIAAFGLVIVAAALIPAPVRATGQRSEGRGEARGRQAATAGAAASSA
jgi:drug/metabolite transporter (DMT)-like permease